MLCHPKRFKHWVSVLRWAHSSSFLTLNTFISAVSSFWCGSCPSNQLYPRSEVGTLLHIMLCHHPGMGILLHISCVPVLVWVPSFTSAVPILVWVPSFILAVPILRQVPSFTSAVSLFWGGSPSSVYLWLRHHTSAWTLYTSCPNLPQHP